VHAGGTFLSPELVRSLDDEPVNTGSALTPRESATLAWLARGYSNKQIARELCVSVRTVETHRLHLRRKLRIDGQAELVKYAIDHMLPLPIAQDAYRYDATPTHAGCISPR
jgi:DNA-binding NarL/FixJ family response regulator